jgi:hypothetical protein
MRVDLLRDLKLSETDVTKLKNLDLDEALFRIGHERQTMESWIARRAAFLTSEVRVNAKGGHGQEHRRSDHPADGQVVGRIVDQTPGDIGDRIAGEKLG